MASPQTYDSRLRGWVQQAERAMSAGQRDEAKRLLAQAKALEADHPLVLNAEGVQELHDGNAVGARRLFERAIESDSGNPGFWLNLATAFRHLGSQADEIKALENVLAIEPRHLLALLQKAALLRLQGKVRESATVYQNALQSIPAGAQLPENLRGPIEKAVAAVRANNAALEAFLSDKVREVRAQHAGEDVSRFDHCLDVLVQKRRIFLPQPTLLTFPKVPAFEFYPRWDFSWLDEIEAASAEIRAEFERVYLEDAAKLEPYIRYPQGVPLDQWAELNHSEKWSVYYLWRDGKRMDDAIARCPRTAALLERAPRVDIPETGPTCFFSILAPKAHIPAHVGVTNTRLIVHVPLVIPPGCRFRVGSETREWEFGKAFVFDDTIEHEAWNDSDVPRAVLIFDIWNPYLTPAERDLVRATVAGVQEYNRT
jgi:aspartyl/asparaginyl beta-hydroxylase (cupin superfamily)/Tfp pilus assembly protein PilF